MRKGFLFILMVVAFAALAVPASALAPVIGELPTLIIGDAEDVSTGDTGVRLMRYVNALNLKSPDVIEWRNGLDDADKKVWYTTSDVDTGAMYLLDGDSSGEFVEPIDATGVADLAAGDNPGESITDGGSFWLSLMNDEINQAAATPALGAAIADVEVNGVDQSAYPAGSTGDPDSARTITLYACEVESYPTTPSLVDSGDFVVWSRIGADEGGVSQEEIFTEDFDATSQWVGSGFDSTTVEEFPYSATAAGLTIDCTGTAAAGTVGYGAWASGDSAHPGIPVPVVPAAGMSGRMFRMTATISNDTATVATDCPQYRLIWQSIMNTHQGYAWMITRPADSAGVYAPTTAGDVDTTVYWEVPLELSECGDSGAMATLGTDPTIGARTAEAWDLTDDGRDYFLQFDAIDSAAQDDEGNISMSHIEVYAVSRPADQTPDAEWGGSGTAFNAGDDGFFTLDGSGTAFGIGEGTATVSATDVVMSATSTGNTGYNGVIAYNAIADNAAAPVAFAADTLYRVSVDATSDVNTCGIWRVVVWAKEGSTGANTHAYIVDQYAPKKTKNVTDALGGPSFMSAPAVPTATGSMVSSYLYSHDGGAADGAIVPQVDIYDAAAPAWSNWAVPQDGDLTISSITVEALTAP
jgi:hypothetical protein